MTVGVPGVLSWFADLESVLTSLAGSWLLESTLVLTVGLFAARCLRRHGAALESAILRATLVGVFLCPVAALGVRVAGITGVRIALTQTERGSKAVEDAPSLPAAFAREETQPFVDVVGPARDVTDAIPVAADSSVAASGAPTEEALVTEIDGAAVVERPSPSAPAVDRRTDVGNAPPSWPRPQRIVAALWMAGSLLLFARLAMANFVLLRVRRRAVPADARIVSACASLAERLGVRAPDVLASDWVAGPCVVGWRKGAILLPAAAPEADHAVLVHELAHLKRHDCLWQLAGQAAVALLWFQPLLWRLVRRIEQAADHVCDDYALELGSGRESYARRLVTLAESHEPGWAETAAAVGIVRFRSSLGQRVQRIVDDARRLSLRVKGRVVVSLLVIAGVCVLTAGMVGIGTQPAATADGAGEDPKKEGVQEPPREQNEPSKSSEVGRAAEFLLSDGSTSKGKLLPSSTAVFRWQPDEAATAKLLRPEEIVAIRLPRPENPPRPAGDVGLDLTDGDVIYGTLRGINADTIEINIAGIDQKLDRGRVDAIYFRFDADAPALELPGSMKWTVSGPKGATDLERARPVSGKVDEPADQRTEPTKTSAGEAKTKPEPKSSLSYQQWRDEKEQQNQIVKDPFGVLSGQAPQPASDRRVAASEGSPKRENAVNALALPPRPRFLQPWQEEGGDFVTDLPKSAAYVDIALPARAVIEVELSWATRPDFALYLGAQDTPRSKASAFRLEAWDRDIVLLRETEREADVSTVGTFFGEGTRNGGPGLPVFSGEAHLRMLLDQEAGRCVVVDGKGRRLADVKISGADRPSVGLSLMNKDRDARLERLRILPWNGTDRPGEDQTWIHLRNGRIVSGRIAGYHPATREVRLSPDDKGDPHMISVETIAGIVFPRQPPPPANRRGPLVGAVRHDGTRLIGQLMRVDEQVLWLRWPATGEPVLIALDDVQSIFVRPQ